MLTLRLLHSTFDNDGSASDRQHYSCFIVNGNVAIDAGSLAIGVTDKERASVRDVVITHAHLDHIAGLPPYIDDLFPILTEPIRVHASKEVIESLETHVFNWTVYPRFSELRNEHGGVIEYLEIPQDGIFDVQGLSMRAVSVNHKVPSVGLIIRSDNSTLAFTGDTAEMSDFWDAVNGFGRLDALLIECAFPDEFEDLANVSHHLTPAKLEGELKKLTAEVEHIYVINMKSAYRSVIISQLKRISDERLAILETGRTYRFG